MSYISLFFASVFEISWVALLANNTATKSVLQLFTLLICMGLSLYLLSFASKTLPIAITYAVWVGLGILGQALLQHFFKTPLSLLSWVFIFTLTFSLLGLLLSQAR